MTRPERIAALRAALAEAERAVAGFRNALRESNLPDHQAFFPQLLDRLTQIIANERAGATAELAGDLFKVRTDLRRLPVSDIDPDLEGPTPARHAVRGARGNLIESLDNALDAAREVGLVPRMTDFGALEVPREAIGAALIRLDERLRIVQEDVANLREEARKADDARANAQLSQSGLVNLHVRTLSVEVSAARFETRMEGQGSTPETSDLAALTRTVEAIRDTARDVKALVDGLAHVVAPAVAAVGRHLSRAAERSWQGVRTVVGLVRRRLSRGNAGREASAGPPPDFDIDEVKRMILAGEAPPAAWVPFITKLDFKGAGEPLGNLDLLRGLTSLQSLSIFGTQVSDLDPLRGLTSLQTLSIDATRVSDLDPLRGLSGLKSLSLVGNWVSDLDPLRGLSSLKSLTLDGNEVSDLDPLRGLTSLQSLSLTDNKVSDLDPLRGLTSLYWLLLDHTKVSDLDPLRGLTNLYSLALDYTQVSDLDPLRGLTNLYSLTLDHTPVSDLDALRGLTSLHSLSLDRTQVSDLTPLRGLKDLVTLDCGTSPVRDIAPLGALPKLAGVRVRADAIHDWRLTDAFASLEHLHVVGEAPRLAPVAKRSGLSVVFNSDNFAVIAAELWLRQREKPRRSPEPK